LWMGLRQRETLECREYRLFLAHDQTEKLGAQDGATALSFCKSSVCFCRHMLTQVMFKNEPVGAVRHHQGNVPSAKNAIGVCLIMVSMW